MSSYTFYSLRGKEARRKQILILITMVFMIILTSFIGHVNTVQNNLVSARSLVSSHILKIYLGTLGSNFPKAMGYYLSNRNTEWEEIPESHRIFISMQEFLNWWLVSSRGLCHNLLLLVDCLTGSSHKLTSPSSKWQNFLPLKSHILSLNA